MSTDIFSGSYETTQGRVYTLSGGDWDTVLGAPSGERERIVVNMGPQHPSTHGVLRLVICTQVLKKIWNLETGYKEQLM
ncbi:MAG: NADH-quinone oxidoreductase chain dehydrogenase chain chain [Actinomycetota bacterium]